MQIAEEFLTEGDSDQWDEVWHRANLTTLQSRNSADLLCWMEQCSVCAPVCVCVCLPVIFKQHKSISCTQEVAYQHLHRSWNALWSSYPLQKKKKAPAQAARWQRKVEQGRQMKTDLLLLLPTNPQSNNCDLHASLFRTPISLAAGGVVRKRRKLLWICG